MERVVEAIEMKIIMLHSPVFKCLMCTVAIHQLGKVDFGITLGSVPIVLVDFEMQYQQGF